MIESFNYLREPLWLVIILIPACLWLLSLLLRSRRSDQYADSKLKQWVATTHSIEQQHRYYQLIFTQLAWIAFAVALAGPRLPEKINDDSHEYFQEVMLLVDLSLSMSARDSLPSRIERAKLEAFDLISRMQNVRLGIVVYAARPHLLTPPTYDKQALRHYLTPLRTQLLPTEGSQTLDAISFAAKQFISTTKLPRSIILISDGESSEEVSDYNQKLDHLTTQLKEHDIQLYALGVGTQQGAALLSSHSGWLEDNQQAVVSKLNRKELVELANIFNGIYSDVRDDDSDWIKIYDQGIALKYPGKSEQQINDLVLWREYYSIFVLIGIVLMFIGQIPVKLFPEILKHIKPSSLLTKYSSYKKPPYQTNTRVSLLLISGLLVTFLASQSDLLHATETDELYNSAYQQLQIGEWQQARDNFAKIPGYQARFAEGVAAYQLEQYKLAITIFIQATLDANTNQQRTNSIFNLANSYFKLAQYQQAESLYLDVLRYQPDHQSALVNLSYASTLLAKQKADQLALKNSAKAKRAGSGPRAANAPVNMDISNSQVSLGDSESNTQNTSNQADKTFTTANSNLGLEDSAPASNRIDAIEDSNWSYDISDLSVLQQKAPRIQTDEAILWQRLFEVEENYEAAQEKPNVLPGVKPW